MAGSVADEKRRVMQAYVSATYPTATTWHLDDLEYYYWHMKAGLGTPVTEVRSLSDIRKLNYGGGPAKDLTQSEISFMTTVVPLLPALSLNDRRLAYWSAL